jgi:hypothetical protein
MVRYSQSKTTGRVMQWNQAQWTAANCPWLWILVVCCHEISWRWCGYKAITAGAFDLIYHDWFFTFSFFPLGTFTKPLYISCMRFKNLWPWIKLKVHWSSFYHKTLSHWCSITWNAHQLGFHRWLAVVLVQQ